jgi:hypothetical protein
VIQTQDFLVPLGVELGQNEELPKQTERKTKIQLGLEPPHLNAVAKNKAAPPTTIGRRPASIETPGTSGVSHHHAVLLHPLLEPTFETRLMMSGEDGMMIDQPMRLLVVANPELNLPSVLQVIDTRKGEPTDLNVLLNAAAVYMMRNIGC